MSLLSVKEEAIENTTHGVDMNEVETSNDDSSYRSSSGRSVKRMRYKELY